MFLRRKVLKKGSDKAFKVAALTTRNGHNGVSVLETNARSGIMKGFIVASINNKSIKQAAGLEAHLIRYTPVLCESETDIASQFALQLPEQMILMTIPVDILKKNIQVLDEMAARQELIAA